MGRSYLLPVTEDLFDIAWRLRSVDDGYMVFYNKLKNRFEVHNRNNRGSPLAFVVPFAGLDARTVDYARKTSAANCLENERECDMQNARVEAAAARAGKNSFFGEGGLSENS